MIENPDEGVDTVRVSFSDHVLAANVENGILIGGGWLHGNSLANSLTGGSGADSLNGGSGDDTLHAGAGDDELFGDSGVDTMFGGLGDDDYYVDNASDIVTELSGEGIDIVIVEMSGSFFSYTLPDHVEDVFSANILATDSGRELHGNALDNWLIGSGLGDLITGLGGNDIIQSGGGNDEVSGGNGDDWLDGGSSADILTGGAGNDTFKYQAYFVSTPSNTDTITDFTSLGGEGSDDELDLSSIDADSTTEGNQAFTFNHSGTPTGTPGELWYVNSWIDDTTLAWEFFGDLDGDSVADFQLFIYTSGPLYSDDLLL